MISTKNWMFLLLVIVAVGKLFLIAKDGYSFTAAWDFLVIVSMTYVGYRAGKDDHVGR